ncbi:MAG: hypothetical protein ETSY2_23970 [Candidatus Entotheonella gemina]|uniref:VOC domain-containing protein n=2 Tax=Candidatus Entotheonella TaxID=93171 RepID=W4M6J7_9BACT|nr:MAG: hypothetical protein ETSY2_23970 [Candidatus Entotheonella gemina]
MSFSTYPKAHIGLQTSNLEAAIDFYTHLFGEAPVKTRPGYAKFLLNSPPMNIALNEHSRVVPSPGHFGIQLATTEDVIARKAAIEPHYEVETEMSVQCCYARQDKFWATDPDGNRWEIFVFHEDVEENDPQYQRTVPQAAGVAAQACCGPDAQ